uniref:Uncharacterized protein n=1 Tax=Glossina austeni TaxID=7395 RepID=A0A1A9UD97_GLOAU
VKKLYHLRNKPKDAVVKRYPLSGENLNLAWKALKTQYENKRVIVENGFCSICLSRSEPHHKDSGMPLIELYFLLLTINQNIIPKFQLNIFYRLNGIDKILVERLKIGASWKNILERTTLIKMLCIGLVVSASTDAASHKQINDSVFSWK